MEMQKKIKEVTYPSDLPPYGSFGRWFRHITGMSFFVYHTRGFVALVKRTSSYLMENISILHLIFFKPGANVLFISGCPGGSFYYRCKNQSELLSRHRVTSRIYGQHSMNLLYLVDKFDIFIFQRVIFDEYMQKLIKLIENRKKTILYETDDLVFDPAYLPFMDYYNRMGEMEKSWYENGIGREILENKYVRHCVVSTNYLAEVIKKKYPDKTIFVSYNLMGGEQIARAESALVKKGEIKTMDGKIRIGYFSGSNSHNRDFESVSDVLLKILRENRNAILMVVGYLDLDKKFYEFKDQIERMPFVPVQKLPELILRADINIAPLEINNPFCQAKSALKFFEAGILGVPTIATATEDFVRCIRNGENGFVAENSEDWGEFLTLLIKDGELRKRIGERARKDSITEHTVGKKNYDISYLKFVKNAVNER